MRLGCKWFYQVLVSLCKVKFGWAVKGQVRMGCKSLKYNMDCKNLNEVRV